MATFLQRNRKRLWAIAVLVVASVGVAALTLPNFNRGRCKDGNPKLACMSKLLIIDDAKERWAFETHQPTNAPVVVAAVNEYIKGGGPKCPQGGKYTYGNVDQPPRCSIKGHTIE